MLNNFRNKIKLERTITLGCVILIIIIGLFLNKVGYLYKTTNDSNFDSFTSGMRFGILCAILLVFILYIIEYTRVLKSEDKLNDAYVQYNDERMQFVARISEDITVKIFRWFLLVMLFTTTFIDSTVAITIMFILVAFSIIQFGSYYYYNKKM